jgi:hypothetical protein
MTYVCELYALLYWRRRTYRPKKLPPSEVATLDLAMHPLWEGTDAENKVDSSTNTFRSAQVYTNRIFTYKQNVPCVMRTLGSLSPSCRHCGGWLATPVEHHLTNLRLEDSGITAIHYVSDDSE